MSWCQFGKKETPDPLDAIFERAYRIRNSETLQNELLPDGLREIVARAPSVDENENVFGAFGTTLTNPIPVNGARGEVIYLSSLRHESGMPLVFHRLGSIWRTDVFEVTTIDGRFWDLLYLDMYHPRKSTRAPEKYTIAPPGQDETGLLRGTTLFVPAFPQGIHAEVATQSRSFFGVAMADPALKAVEQATSGDRPKRHARFLETLRLDGRLQSVAALSAEERCAMFVDDLTLGIEEALLGLHATMRQIAGSDDVIKLDRAEVVYLAASSVLALVRKTGAKRDLAPFVDAAVTRVLTVSGRDIAVGDVLLARLDEYLHGFERMFSGQADLEALVEPALVQIKGRTNALEVPLFSAHFTVLLVEALAAVKQIVK